MFFVGSALWILPIALLVIGLLLAARSVKKAVAWLSWPLIATGLLGMVTASCLPGLSFLHSVPKDMPGQIPGYMLGIGRKLGIDLAVMLEKAMFTPFLLMAVVGGLLLVITFRKQMVLLAINTWHSFGMVFGRQADGDGIGNPAAVMSFSHLVTAIINPQISQIAQILQIINKNN